MNLTYKLFLVALEKYWVDSRSPSGTTESEYSQPEVAAGLFTFGSRPADAKLGRHQRRRHCTRAQLCPQPRPAGGKPVEATLKRSVPAPDSLPCIIICQTGKQLRGQVNRPTDNLLSKRSLGNSLCQPLCPEAGGREGMPRKSERRPRRFNPFLSGYNTQ
jgi:hypothetical protein